MAFDLEKYAAEYQGIFANLHPGDNLLVKTPQNVSLLKFEGFRRGPTHPNIHPINRHVSVMTMPDSFLARLVSDGRELGSNLPGRPVAKSKLCLEIDGSHKLEFTPDRELCIHLVSASFSTDMHLNVATEFTNGDVELMAEKGLTIIADQRLLEEELSQITRPTYYAQNIEPFLNNQPTDLHAPSWQRVKLPFPRNLFSRSSRINSGGQALAELSSVIKSSRPNDFVYVGSEHQAYVMGVTVDDDGSRPYMQGTYVTSSHPPLFFSNNYLGPLSAMDVELRPLHPGNMRYNSSNYRTISPPEFRGRPFVFTAIGVPRTAKMLFLWADQMSLPLT